MTDALILAIRFHETYERLAPSFGYETRPDTKAFDPESKNGRLMVATCAAILAERGSAARPGAKGRAELEATPEGRALLIAAREVIRGDEGSAAPDLDNEHARRWRWLMDEKAEHWPRVVEFVESLGAVVEPPEPPLTVDDWLYPAPVVPSSLPPEPSVQGDLTERAGKAVQRPVGE